MVGDSAVGKTCIVQRYVKQEFNDNYAPTVFDAFKANLNMNNESIDF